MYGGGPLSISVGDALVDAGIRLRNGYGGTEFGNPPLSWDKIPQPDLDWYWHYIQSPNMVFESQGDGTFELVINVHLFSPSALLTDLTFSLKETDDYHLAVHNVPGDMAYATSDVFEPHPTKPGLWKM